MGHTVQSSGIACPKIMGFWPTLAFVISSQVGAGVFFFPCKMALFGIPGSLSWLVAGVGALLLAYVFARSCGATAHTSGPHTFVVDMFGRSAGFYVAFVYWVLAWLSFVPLLNVMASAFFTMISVTPTLAMEFWVKVMLLMTVLAFNLRGIQASGILEVIICSIKIVCLIAIPLVGIFSITPQHFELPPLSEPMHLLSKGTLIAFWGFTGVESITAPASYVKNPQKNISRAIMWGTSVAVLIYLLNTTVIIGVVPPTSLHAAPCAHTLAIERLLGPGHDQWLAGVMLVVCLGALNAWMLVAGHVAQGAAQEGLFHRFFVTHNRFGAPVKSLLVSAVMCLVLLVGLSRHTLAGQIDAILDVAVVGYLGVYIVSIAAYLKRWWGQAPEKRTFRDLFLALSAGAFCLWPLWGAGIQTVASASLMVLLAGGVKRLWWGAQHKVA